uniref:Uncharacterized protein n=1 Tax=Pediculus humanus subsp. corporis TaxID=121224 RepID=A0A1S4N208_PEDHC
MNDKEGWNTKDTCMEQYMYSSPTAPFMFPDSNNWSHVPPQTMPWGTPAELQPSVVRFTAGNFNGSTLLSCKRKSEPPIDMPPAKMLVTDEKMAAHMQSLHISEIENEKMLSNMSCKDESMETDSLPKLILSDEIKNLKTDMIFPESVFKRLEKPEMALVLWQPPLISVESKLNKLNKSCKTKNEESDEKSTDNNNSLREKTDDKSMDITMEANIMNNIDNTFRPIDPVPKPSTPTQYYQPVPHFQGYTSFF